MIRAGLRRIVVILAVVLAGTAAISVGLGALARADLARALADGFYVVGALALVGSFVLGSRGPMRVDRTVDPDRPTRGLRQRGFRKATPEERTETRWTSLGLFVFGIVLVLIGAAVDPSRHAL